MVRPRYVILGHVVRLVVATHITPVFTVYFMRLHLVYRDLSNLKLDERLASFTLLANSVHRNKQFNHSVGKSKAPLEYFSLSNHTRKKGRRHHRGWYGRPPQVAECAPSLSRPGWPMLVLFVPTHKQAM